MLADTARIIVTGMSGLVDGRKEDGSLKWQHEARYTSKSGRTKASCVCGWQGEKRDSYAEARFDYDRHVGLAEKSK